jgi:endonuclease/exonuclease/phosphatase family metal-dependent hydrolase
MDEHDRRAAADRWDGADRLRVATWNLYLGADLSTVFGNGRTGDLDTDLGEVVRQLSATPFEQRAPLVAQTLVAQQVDVVGLQEVCTWTYDGAVTADFEALLLAELAALGEEYDVVVRQATFRGAADLPDALGSGRVALTGHDVLMVRRGGPVRVESAHHGTFSQRLHLEVLGGHHQTVTRGWCAARCRLGEDGAGLTVVTTHTEAHGAQERDRQRDELLAAVDSLAGPGTPTVLVGDFNAAPEEVGMPACWQDAWTAAGHVSDDAAGHTSGQAPDLANTDSMLRQRIDYVFVRDAAVTACVRVGADPEDRVDGRWPSDHAGVVAEVRLP